MANTGYDYVLALYVNNKRKRVLGKYKKYKEALEAYENTLEENKVLFPKEYKSFKEECNTDLILYGYKGDNIKKHLNTQGLYEKAEFKDKTLKLKRLAPFQMEESFIWYHPNGKQKITFSELMKIIEVKSEVFTIKAQLTTNKISFEYFENDEIADLFVLKNKEDAERLYELVQNTCINTGIINILFFYDNDYEEKSLLYDRLIERLPINRDYLIRPYTH